MAVVLQSDENSYFQTSALRRSHSQPKIGAKHSSFHSSPSASRAAEAYHQHNTRHAPIKVLSDSALSPESSSARIARAEAYGFPHPSAAPPINRTPDSDSASASGDAPAPGPALLSDNRPHPHPPTLDEGGNHVLPAYGTGLGFGGSGYFHRRVEDDPEAPPSPRSSDSYSVSPNDNDTLTTEDPSHPVTPDCYEHADDDIALRTHPSRHVDYLSHNWREEDIWESWKYIVARKSDYSNAARLENASWRTWMKSKNKLRTVSPETLNWLKDCDVTWLYGPLQTGLNSLVHTSRAESVGTNTPKSPSNAKKPILKKRSMSEVMLQRSISTSSLVKQAAAAVQAQQKEGVKRPARPMLSRAATDYVTLALSSRRQSPGNSSRLESTSSSRLESPAGGERKHIHFNEQVEQCIAVDIKGDDDDEFDSYRYGHDHDEDSDSENDAIMMKRTSIKKKRPVLRRNRSATGAEKTIAMLPSTTLKYREDTPEPPETATAMKHSYRSPTLTPSSSQETLRPSAGSSSREKLRSSASSGKTKFAYAGDDKDDDSEDDDPVEDGSEADGGDSLGLGPGHQSSRRALIEGGLRSPPLRLKSPLSPSPSSEMAPPLDEIPPSGSGLGQGLRRTISSSSFSAEPTGMRRTESGMFMPFEEGDPPGAAGGLVGRVIDTVNTARDIAHVIWNVGWRK